MEKSILSVHEHPLYHVGGNLIHGNYDILLTCMGCYGEGHIDKGYRCSKCPRIYFHKKCAESSAPEIKHPSHPNHPLKLLAGPDCDGKRCHLCGLILELLCYHCSICDFTLDTGCAINPPPLPIIHQPKSHEHTLTLVSSTDQTDFTCHLCGENRQYGKFFYSCSLCEDDLFFHIDCAFLSLEIIHPYHPRHLLRFLQSGGEDSFNFSRCWLCGRCIARGSCYQCSICKFTVDIKCVKNPPPLTLVSPKTHEHQLTLMPRLMSFTCNACGKRLTGETSPYVCIQCNFIVHGPCVDLPRVIYINRHDHPMSHTYDLDLLENSSQECGVCRKSIDTSYGAYSFSKCKDYAVHSRCATMAYIWDGRDIEGEPEEIEDVAPFKVIGDGLITHFSHEEHDMKLIKDGKEITRCIACVELIGVAETYYKCTMQCDFILHERCANLPRMKRHMLLPEKFFLVGGASYFDDTFCCWACGRYSSGFRYKNGHYQVDLQCISVSEPLKRETHHHPLYYFAEKLQTQCSFCNRIVHNGFECLDDNCWYYLHFACALYPERVKHKSDDHTLRLCYQEYRRDNKYWCDICEKQIGIFTPDYYTCDECGTTFHIECVLGDLFGSSILPGSIIKHQEVKYDIYMKRYNYDEYWEYEFEVVLNIGVNRSLCCVCHSRCTFSLVLKTHDKLDRYICSYNCLSEFRPTKNVTPPEIEFH